MVHVVAAVMFIVEQIWRCYWYV